MASGGPQAHRGPAVLDWEALADKRGVAIGPEDANFAETSIALATSCASAIAPRA
jgi:hypothetical protein